MRYTTDFTGEFKLNKPLSEAHAKYLIAFNMTRRVQRGPAITATRPAPIREAVELPVGEEGGYFVGEEGEYGQGSPTKWNDRMAWEREAGILNYNRPPKGQPGLWCKWTPICSDDRDPIYDRIGWDGAEKFYEYVEWLEYVVEHFLKPWGYKLNGKVSWQGEDVNDRGVIHVKNNKVKAVRDQIVCPEPDFDK